LLDRGLKLFCHACNSAAAVRFPEFALDGVRFGILLYGVCPSEHVEVCTKPVMSLHTVISHLHKLNVGETVSYGGNYSSDEERTIATLPIGYADGFMRAFSGFNVTVQTSLGNFKAPVVGNVCMDQCMIDVTGIPASICDKVTIFGNDRMDLTRLAKLANTIEYEVLCLISARVPRIARNKAIQ
jgi:alanine racemase